MSPVSFLLIAVVIAIIGTLVVVAANRSPSRPDSAMEEFEREMRALAPRPPTGGTTPRRTTPLDVPPTADDADDTSAER